MPSPEYYLRQAELASRLALIEADPAKARALHAVALDFCEKAARAKAEQTPDAYRLPKTSGGRSLET